MFMKRWLVLVALALFVLCLSAGCAENPIDPNAIAIGDIVTFGCYEQDRVQNNGSEPIEWIVLDIQDGKALLLSKYALDAKQYHEELNPITWEACTLRTWLNTDFMEAAFNETERQAILLTDVDNSVEQGCATWAEVPSGNNTQDYIFLLSYHEAFELYFSDREPRICTLTDYTRANGGNHESDIEIDGKPAGYWWLRSPGCDSMSATIVFYDGGYTGNDVDDSAAAVRPAFWLNLESDIF